MRNFELSLKARQTSKAPKDSELGLIFSHKGLIYLLMKEYKKAAESYEEAIQCFSQIRKKELAEW